MENRKYKFEAVGKDDRFKKATYLSFEPEEKVNDIKKVVDKGNKYWKKFFGLPIWHSTAEEDLYTSDRLSVWPLPLKEVIGVTFANPNHFVEKNDGVHLKARVCLFVNSQDSSCEYFDTNEEAYNVYENYKLKCKEAGNQLISTTNN